jgi:glycopeptide antibiotics resistance protein
MAAANTHNHSLPQRLLAELRVRHLANFLIVVSVLVVLGTTLYPFDFTTEDMAERWSPFIAPKFEGLSSAKDDIVTNVVLFLPIGVSLGILLVRRRMKFFAGFVLATIGGALLSLTVELLQLFLPFRYASFLDVASNATGAAIGYVFYVLTARPVYRLLTRAVESGNAGNASGWLVAGYCAYLLGVLLITVPLQRSSLTNEFNKFSYPLVVGNEPTGDRPWIGRVHDLIITRHGLSPEGVANYLAHRPLTGDDARMMVAHYVFEGKAPYYDRTRLNAPLEWHGIPPESTETEGAVINDRRWLQTAKPAYEISSWIMETNRFTICFSAANNPKSFPEKARIISVSANPYQRNFSIVQLGNDLGIRYRSMTTGFNGTNPQFVVPDVFADSALHRIVVSLHAKHLHVYVDSIQRHYDVELGPGFALLNRSFPMRGALDMSSPMRNFHNYLFQAIAFMPLGYLLGLLLTQQRTHLALRLCITALGIVLPPFLVEYELHMMIGGDIARANVDFSIALIAATTALTWLYHVLKPGINRLGKELIRTSP